MTAFSINAPPSEWQLFKIPGIRLSTLVVAIVMLTGIGLLAWFSYLAFRDIPENGSANRIDSAQGVTPQYPPTTPARAW